MAASSNMARSEHLQRNLKRRLIVKRRRYKVPHPNYLWHIDSHHKLIFWGIVVHGVVDGHCHSVSAERMHQ